MPNELYYVLCVDNDNDNNNEYDLLNQNFIQ